ncbi:MAG: SDR family NAD(P)-dependent oxidoreductase [Leptotrichiaceae bacterium]|jgi:short-subunit dehydrogenase|nr:SDR family NAD(P)-dependent oxidoreductase [Fusobacteriaceae bacterium]MBP6468006.1 SDR family NAD(P)-dependent oxidoreductase [Fusobacteriaceae bacterium]MBU9918467.1 SDR family NAD(P)-dependent oxidoreductase [Fusobacteriaceae bacterium]
MARVLVTGGSRGIGKAIAEEFLKRGYDTILVAKNKIDLEKTKIEFQNKYKNQTIITEAMDLREEENLHKLIDKYNEIDILVNNAGILSFGYSHEIDNTTLLNGIKLNIEAPCFLGNHYIREILNSGNSKNIKGIINVSSISGIFPHPLTTFYSPSKYFLDQYSCNMKYEINKKYKDKKINIMSLCPGSVDTDIFGDGKFTNINKYSKILKSFGLMLSTEYVARVAVKDFFKGKKRSIVGKFYKLMWYTMILFPKRIVYRLMYKGMVEEI